VISLIYIFYYALK